MNEDQRQQITGVLADAIAICIRSGERDLAQRIIDAQKMVMNDKGRRAITDEQRKYYRTEALKMREQGMGWKQIAEKLGVKHGSVYNWVMGSKKDRKR